MCIFVKPQALLLRLVQVVGGMGGPLAGRYLGRRMVHHDVAWAARALGSLPANLLITPRRGSGVNNPVNICSIVS